ncbi:hypothetical protein HPB52_004138 [Rhipicephalus sanguineus]|uniref:Uncharacterized protein n=1 Tax=Rhipicephalus sanguineus TaxID=34632 RepID=A0A9D4Q4P1_RHISA|nr:hypothetical protein HPB52_004138 [Rhipicephalus sanguineus]
MTPPCRRTPSNEEKAASKLSCLFGYVQRQFQAKLLSVPSGLQPLHSAIGGSRTGSTHAIRRVEGSDCQRTHEDDMAFAYAGMTLLFLLHTLQAASKQVQVAELFAAESDFDWMLCANINDSVTCLRLEYGKARLDPGRELLGALESNSTITCLSVDCRLVSLGHGPRFKDWLTRAAALKELSLACSQCWRKHEAKLVFQALPTTTGITRLDVQGFVLHPTDSTSLSELVACGDHLEDASFAFGNITHRRSYMCHADMFTDIEEAEESNGAWMVDAFVEALSKTTSLRRLAVMGGFSASDIRRLLKAAHDCASLEELTCEAVTFGRTHFNRGKDIFPRATHLVTVRRCEDSVEHMQPLVETWTEMLRETSLYPLGLLHSSSFHVCLALAENCGDHVTALSLDLQGGVTPQLAQILAVYLASTRNLRMLSLIMSCWDHLEHAIVEGLIQNNSIEELHLENFALNESDSAALGRWFDGNRRLHTLSVSLEVSKYGTREVPPGTETLLLTLASTLEKNNALTCIRVDGYWAYMPTWYIIKHKVSM